MKKIILIIVLIYFLIGLVFSYAISYPKGSFSKTEMFRLGFINGRNFKIITYWPLYIALSDKIFLGNSFLFHYSVPLDVKTVCSITYSSLTNVNEFSYIGGTGYVYDKTNNICITIPSAFRPPFNTKNSCYVSCVKKAFPLNLIPNPPSID